jgi:phosphoglycerol transferase MdoB-like AlkP superfamily enzyme
VSGWASPFFLFPTATLFDIFVNMFPNSRITKAVLILLFQMVLYTVCRILFILFNKNNLSSAGFIDTLLVLGQGLRFDMSAIAMLNAVVFVLILIPGSFQKNIYYQKFVFWLYLGFNLPALFLNCMDIGYFSFTRKRTTSDFFSTIFISSDLESNLFNYIVDYWYLTFIFLFLSYLSYRFFPHRKSVPENSVLNKKSHWTSIYSWFPVVLSIVLVVLAVRGGIQLKPLRIVNAAASKAYGMSSAILNTPFTIIKSFNQKKLEDPKYYSPAELDKIYPIDKEPSINRSFQPLNVVIIIMESFSIEYTHWNPTGTSYTPFLDSLSTQGLSFTSAYANGKKSIEALPSILSGIPSLMNEPFITSPFASNEIAGLAHHLKQKKYKTSFFHGGTNGTMGFDQYVASAGIDHYFGRSQYPQKKDYDGSWGIYDEPFFKFFADKLSTEKQPFFSCFFSLTSHHPYSIPDQYQSRFTKGDAIHSAIEYADYSLEQFFKIASKMAWYNHTLFVITADHTGPAGHEKYGNKAGMYRVPLIFFSPAIYLKGNKNTVAQHIDIFPTVLDILGYDKPFKAFGNSLADSLYTGVSFNFNGETYQIIKDDYLLEFTGEKSIGLYHIANDELLKTNLIQHETTIKDSLETNIKAIIQRYNLTLTQNLFRTTP